MNPDTNFRPRGSFGIPKELQQKAEDAQAMRSAPAEEKVAPQQAPPATEFQDKQAAQEAEEVKQENEKQSRLENLKAAIETDLGISINENDVRDYVLKGVLHKKVVIVEGIMTATFKTLTPKELLEIDEKLAAIRNDGKYTSAGVDNEKSMLDLTYGWVEVNGKALGKDLDTRADHIHKMGALVVEKASEYYINFNTLVKIALQSKGLVKKS